MKKLAIILSLILALIIGFIVGFKLVIKSPKYIKIYGDHYEIITNINGYEFLNIAD